MTGVAAEAEAYVLASFLITGTGLIMLVAWTFLRLRDAKKKLERLDQDK